MLEFAVMILCPLILYALIAATIWASMWAWGVGGIWSPSHSRDWALYLAPVASILFPVAIALLPIVLFGVWVYRWITARWGNNAD